MRVVFKKTPLKRLRAMQPNRAIAIRMAVQRIADDPTGQHPNLKPLVGVPDGFRIRVGDWRVSFTVDDASEVMEVFEIEPRGSAYR